MILLNHNELVNCVMLIFGGFNKMSGGNFYLRKYIITRLVNKFLLITKFFVPFT